MSGVVLKDTCSASDFTVCNKISFANKTNKQQGKQQTIGQQTIIQSGDKKDVLTIR